ncbi:MAG: Rrf2 family transcriptional regulator [Bacteriovoracaceae bacterium]|nr:Rrf2 family transcriptional regulator [Bacteriovoracaceae bacterium]
MIKVNRKVEYALMSLGHVLSKKKGELTSAREICDRFKIPFDTIAKVLQIMSSAEILSSAQGVRGGYQLVKDLKQVNFLELCELIEGKAALVDCEMQGRECEFACHCNIMSPMKNLGKKLESFLKSVTVDELLTSQAAPVFLENIV